MTECLTAKGEIRYPKTLDRSPASINTNYFDPSGPVSGTRRLCRTQLLSERVKIFYSVAGFHCVNGSRGHFEHLTFLLSSVQTVSIHHSPICSLNHHCHYRHHRPVFLVCCTGCEIRLYICGSFSSCSPTTSSTDLRVLFFGQSLY